MRKTSLMEVQNDPILSHMADAAFDTKAVTRQLEAKGFSADRAEAITESVRDGASEVSATKADN